MYYKKLDEYFKSKGIRKNQVAKTLDVSAAQIGKYLSGKDRISSVMINKIKKKLSRYKPRVYFFRHRRRTLYS